MSRPLQNQTALQIISENDIHQITIAYGGAPTAAASGYAKGCLWIDTTNGIVYVNEGSATSTTWNASLVQGGAESIATLTITGNEQTSVATVAALGTNQATAAALTKDNNYVTAADGTVGVALPTAVAGMRINVKNDDAANAVLKVYPATGAAINAIAANGAISMAAKTSAQFWAYSTTQWFTIPLLPS